MGGVFCPKSAAKAIIRYCTRPGSKDGDMRAEFIYLADSWKHAAGDPVEERMRQRLTIDAAFTVRDAGVLFFTPGLPL
jgi:hypothetical protein